MEENLKRKTTKALVWSTADKLGQQLFYLVAGIILARQLSPEDYGKVGVLTIFIALSGILIDSGFSSALIRKKEATQADYSTVFYVNVAISCVLYGLLYAAAPYIAVFFKVPDLIYICRILFLVIPLNALSLIQQTLLLKQFKLFVVVGYRFGRRHCDGLRRYGSLVVGGSDARPLAFQGCFFLGV